VTDHYEARIHLAGSLSSHPAFITPPDARMPRASQPNAPVGATAPHRSGPRFSSGEVALLLAHIENNIGSRMCLDALSRRLALSKWHFSRSFKALFGTPPHRFIMELRVKRAQSLLLHSSLTMSQIACDCGFADQPHFIRVFRKYVGASPGAWRRQASVHEPEGSTSKGRRYS
jgi:transcriptional regulator GlxA family with amidase domain